MVTEKGLLGRVTELGLDWCRVEALTDPSVSIGVYTDRTGAKAVISGSAELRQDGLCKMTYISSSDLQMGDKVYTAGGESGLYPSGLLVGSVSDIYIDEATGELTATVTPEADLSSISEVLVICGYERQD